MVFFRRGSGFWLLLLLAAASVTAAPRRKVKIIFVRYNLLKEGEELSVIKNNPIVSGQINQVVLTLFNTSGKDYKNITIKPLSRDRYLNIRMADRTRGEIELKEFRGGALKTLRGFPIIITVAPTCPDEYQGTVYLEIKSPGFRKTLRQFVVEVSNPGILASGSDKFNELYGGLGVKAPPSVKDLKTENPKIKIVSHRRRSGKKGRNSESISHAIGKYQLEIYYCYQQQLRKFPKLRGNVIMKFTIHPAGNVANIKVIRSTLNNKDVEGCLVRRMKTWKFPTIPRSYGALDVTYPFEFDSISSSAEKRRRRR